MTCPHSIDDGAYVLGALAPADRAAFEAHLNACPACRESVASLAVLPGLLGRLGGDAHTFLDIDGPATASPALLPRILAAAGTERRRARRIRRLRAAAGVLAAACIAVFVGVGVHFLDRPPTVTLTAMQPLGTNVNVTAEVGVTKVAGGTKVDMHCYYKEHNDGKEHRPWPVFLYVISHTGSAEQIGVWMAEGGQDLSVSGMTRYDPDAIAAVELRRGNGDALLRWTPT